MKFYLDKNQITRLASNTDTYHHGYTYWLNGRVRDVSLTMDNSACIASAVVSGTKSDYKVMVAFDGNGVLQRYNCMCSSAGIWHGACKHVVATLLSLHAMNRERVVISRSSRISNEVLQAFEALTYADVAADFAQEVEPAMQVSFVPEFMSAGDGRAQLSFAIGRRKKYIIKNMREFVRRMREGEVFAYGKDLELTHKLSSFDAESRELLALILREFTNFDTMSAWQANLRQAFDQVSNTRFFPLSARNLDAFFALYNGQTVKAAVYGAQAEAVRLSSSAPGLMFDIDASSDGMELSMTSDAFLFAGEGYHYILCGETLHRVTHSYAETAGPLLSAFQSLGAQRMLFPSRDLSRVRTFLAAQLRKHGLLRETGAVKETLTGLPLTKKAYFDTDGRTISCRASFVYGEQAINPIEKQGDIADMIRDVPNEFRFQALLEQIGFVPDERTGTYTLTGGEQIFRFYHEPNGLAALRENAEIFITDAVRNVAEKPRASVSVGLRISGNLLEVKVNADGFSMLELMDILDAHRVQKKYYRLRDGSFINFADAEQNEAFGAVSELMQGLGASKKDIEGDTIKTPAFRALVASNVLEKRQAHIKAARDVSFQTLVADFQSYASANYSVPQALASVLRAYQTEGFKWLTALDCAGFGGILADDMGLGKTVQMIAVLLAEKEKASDAQATSIVVAPTSLVYNWEKEIARFAPELRTCMICNGAARRQELLEGEASAQADVLITTYDMLKRDIALYENKTFRFIIADEAQNIKNPVTQNARALKLLKGRTRFALTGTPMENALIELWSIFDFIMPGYLHSRSKFTKLYEEPILRGEDAKVSAVLKRQIMPFVLRRLKSDVLTELPEKIETTLYAEMTAEQQKVYTAYLMQAKGELSGAFEGDAYRESQIEILSKLTRLRQLCCHPATFMENYKGGSGKLDATVETVLSSVQAGHRLLVFSQFTKMLDILGVMLSKEGIPYFSLYGSTPSKDRLDMAERFNNGAREVFLISLKAGGTGLNLTGADVVIHYDPWWNPAVMDQAADRAHRFGQDKTVHVINIVAKDSIEEKIMTLQAKKKSLIDSVVEEGAHFIGKMAREDVQALFNE